MRSCPRFWSITTAALPGPPESQKTPMPRPAPGTLARHPVPEGNPQAVPATHLLIPSAMAAHSPTQGLGASPDRRCGGNPCPLERCPGDLPQQPSACPRTAGGSAPGPGGRCQSCSGPPGACQAFSPASLAPAVFSGSGSRAPQLGLLGREDVMSRHHCLTRKAVNPSVAILTQSHEQTGRPDLG